MRTQLTRNKLFLEFDGLHFVRIPSPFRIIGEICSVIKFIPFTIRVIRFNKEHPEYIERHNEICNEVYGHRRRFEMEVFSEEYLEYKYGEESHIYD